MGWKTSLLSPRAVLALARGKKTSASGGSSGRWMQRHVKDPYVQKAHELGYRARSAFKLLEIDQGRHLLKPGIRVVECGAAPGAWTQVAAAAVNAGGHYNPSQPSGTLVGCDLLSISPVNGATLLPFSDFTDKEVQRQILELCEGRGVDLVLSDMAPNATGDSDTDHERIVNLVYSAFRFGVTTSAKGAGFVGKIWNGNRTEKLVSDLARFYSTVEKVKPRSSRKDSAEMFVVARDFKGIKNKK